MILAHKFYPFESGHSPKYNFIILHGLFGSSKNWVTVSRYLSKFGNVYSLDLRNHGDSPHTAEHSIPLMAEDIYSFLQEKKLTNVILLGHSMGGLVSLYFDCMHPNLLSALIIQDIAPRSYPFIYDNEIASLSFPLQGYTSRSEIDSEMKKFVPDVFIRQFLQMSLDRNETGEYRWKMNVDVINHSRRVFENPFPKVWDSKTPCLFLVGGDSEYISPSDKTLVEGCYPHVVWKVIPGGGHYIHYTHQDLYLDLLRDFIQNL